MLPIFISELSSSILFLNAGDLDITIFQSYFMLVRLFFVEIFCYEVPFMDLPAFAGFKLLFRMICFGI